ncbi:MAG: hypothetical protein LBV08_01130 [Clostridiales bacterium]|jgi:flagellar motility protein MotE (MotC chaperone)|nr:hypothetical protein [Clostridiales bacterium]
MAKKNDVDERSKLLSENNLEDKRPKKKSKLPLILFILFLGLIAAVFSLNLFNVREKALYPLAKNIPIVKNLLPEEGGGSEYDGLSKENLIEMVKNLEGEIAQANEDYVALQERFNDRGGEIVNLQRYKDQIDQFNSDKSMFDEAVANNDQKAFIQFYENMFPENAEELYKEAVSSVQNDKDLKKYANTFSSMDEGSAAEILEKLMGSDIELVVTIFKSVDTDTGAAILAQMDTDNAANIARRIAPVSEG